MGVSASPGRLRPIGRAGERHSAGDEVAPRAAVTDSWPHTTRLLPWSVAGFLTMLWLLPFDAITVPALPMPVDATLDRVLFVVVLALWASWFLVGRSRENLRARITAIDAAILMFLGVAVLGIVVNAETLIVAGEFDLALKKVAILGSLMLLFYVVATGLRASELPAFSVLLVVLASLAAVGVIYEYRSGVNVFYDWAASLLPGAFSVERAPSDPLYGRESVTGPTAHAIAIATALSMALPFAVTGYMTSSTTRRRVLYALAITLLLAGCLATVRRTGAVGPAAALIALILYRPRWMLRLLPMALVVLLVAQVLAPDAPSRVKDQFVGFFEDDSIQGRTNDYKPVTPDIRDKLLLGRGHGSYDPSKHRFLDNEWLGRVIETGVIGAVAYLLLILAVMRVGHRAGRVKDPARRSVGIAVVAAAAVYAVTSAVFDALSFPQAPYMFFFVAGLAVVALDRRPESPSVPA